MVDEQAAPVQVRGLGHRDPRHVVHHRQVGVAGAQALDGLAGLDLQHLDDDLGVRAAEVTHRRRNEGGQGARERGQAQTRRAATQILHGGFRPAQRREHPLDVRAQARARGVARRGRCERSTSAVPTSRSSVASCCDTADCV